MIHFVTHLLQTTALQTLPKRGKPKAQRKWYKDWTLSLLAARKKEAWDRWSGDGRPSEGPLYEEKTRSRAEFRRKVNICVANEERRRIQHVDQRFKQKSSRRFQSKKAITRQGTTLRVDQLVTSDPNTILTEWERHFRGISASNEDQFPTLCAIKQQVEHLHIESQENKEMILDVSFCAEEVKPGKSAGHDMIDPEHIKYGGEILKIWIHEICNAIVELEHVPESLKLGIVTLIYKGGGRDPLNTSSYRGITLTSVIAKILESLVLERLQVVLMEKGLPHPNQTAYRKRVACAEAIFSTFEAISQFAQHGEKVCLCS